MSIHIYAVKNNKAFFLGSINSFPAETSFPQTSKATIKDEIVSAEKQVEDVKSDIISYAVYTPHDTEDFMKWKMELKGQLQFFEELVGELYNLDRAACFIDDGWVVMTDDNINWDKVKEIT